MQRVVTHISNPKIITACTTVLNNIPDNLGYFLYWPMILVSRAQFFRAFFKFPTTAGQLPYPAVNTRTRYLNKVTISSGLP